MKKLLFITTLISPLLLISPLIAQANSNSYPVSQSQYDSQANDCGNGNPFSDVPENHWAYDAVTKLSSCQQVANKKASVLISSPATSKLKAAPTKITIAGRSYKVEAFVWRDFMPISPPDGKPMIASIKLIVEDGNSVPENLLPHKLWVMKSGGGEVWETSFTDEPIFSKGNVQIIARNGPKWEPDTDIDVVVQLLDGNGSSNSNKIYLLRSPCQKIQKVS